MSRLLSFVVPAYNSERTLERCLRSILAQDLNESGWEAEVVVVDNRSTDASKRIAERHPVRVADEAVPGAASARNRGIEEARGEHIALIDSDCEIPFDWARRALELLERTGGCCAVGGPGRLPSSGVIARCLNGLHYGVRPTGPPRAVRSLATMNALYDGAVLRQNRFDPRYFWAEDAELNLRLVEAGYTLLFDPTLTVVHHHPTSLGGVLRKWYEYGLQYPGPYLKRGRLFSDPGFLPRLLYLPVLVLLLLLGAWRPSLLWAAAAWLLAPPVLYFWTGLRSVRGVDLLVFPFFHTAKQWAQMLGMVIGTVAPGRRVRRMGGQEAGR